MFALPILVAEFLQEMHYAVDSFIAGNYLRGGSSLAIAAIGSTWYVMLLFFSFLVGFSIGGSVVIAQFVGARKEARLGNTITTLIIALLVAAPVISAISFFFADDLLRLLRVPREIMPLAIAYLRTLLVGLIFMIGYSQVSAIYRGLGDAKTPLLLVLLSITLNTIFSLTFIFVFNIGIVGLGVATITAQGIAFVVGIALLMYRDRLIPRKLKEWKFNFRIWVKVMKLAAPVGLDMMFVAGSLLAIAVFINDSGPNVIAAITIAQTVDELVLVVGMALAGAVSVFVGQNLAAGQYQRARKGVVVGAVIALGVAVLATVFAIFGSEPLARMFTNNLNIVAIVKEYLFIVGIFYVVYTTTLVVTGALQGAGRTILPMIASLLSLWVVRVPLTWILSDRIGPKGIWWAQVVAWILCYFIIIGYARFTKLGMMLKQKDKDLNSK